MPAKRTLGYLALGATSAVALIPTLWILVISLRSTRDVADDPIGLPVPPTLANYTEAWNTARFGDYLLNSFLIAVGVVVLVVITGLLAAFGMTTLRPPGSGALLAVFLIGMTLPIWALINPLFRLVRDAGLLDTRSGVILVEAAIGLPLAIFLFRSFLRDIPTDLVEAAVIDGATPLRVLVHVTAPLALPVVYTVIVFQFMFSWNEFVIPLFLLQSDEARTLPLGLSFFQGRYGSDQSLVSAGAIMASAPIVFVYLLFQRHFVSGLTAGAVKG